MKVAKIILFSISILILFGTTNVKAYKEEELQNENNNLVKNIVANLSEEDNVIDLLNRDITINNDIYKVITIEKSKNEAIKKNITEEKKEILQTNSQEYIKKHFGETFLYEDEEFKGEIPLTHININEIDKGQYQEIRDKKIEFSNYSKNDLNNIKKEITDNDLTYYLINVDWDIDKIETIDNQEVPKSYKGTMLYQTIVTIDNPSQYEVTATYEGQAIKKDEEYTYKAIYQKQQNDIEQPMQEQTNITSVIIISGLGIGMLILSYLIFSKNVIVYNKTGFGFKVISSFKLGKDKNNDIDLSRYNYKIESNIYALKLKKGIYEDLKGKVVNIKIKNITKQITINERFIEFII